MDDYVLYISAREFPPDAQSSITGKRKTARICHVEHEEEDSYQVSWSVRAAPTVQYIPRRMLSYAIKSMLETAQDCAPVQIFFILEDLYSDNWFIELVAFLVQATSADFMRPVIIHLVQSQQAIQDNIDTSELEAMLNSSSKLELERAIPAPWCWYGDLCIPGYDTPLFTIVIQSEDPVISDLFSSTKQRNRIKFIDILNGGEKSDLSLDQLQEMPMNILLPSHVIHCLRKILKGGFMLIRLPGNYTSSNYALYETNTRQWVIRKISDPCKKEKYETNNVEEVEEVDLPEISARHLTESIFDPNFDLSAFDFDKSDDFGILPAFSPVDVNRALEQLKITPKKEEKRARIGSDISFFSPSKILSNKIKIVENIDEARALRVGKLFRSNRRNKKTSPIQPTKPRSLCGLNEDQIRPSSKIMKEPSPIKRIMRRNCEKQGELFHERVNETASLASNRPPKKQKLSRHYSLTQRQKISQKVTRRTLSQTDRKSLQAKRNSTGEVMKQTKLTDRRHSMTIQKSDVTTKTKNDKSSLYKRSHSNISTASNGSLLSNGSNVSNSTGSCSAKSSHQAGSNTSSGSNQANVSLSTPKRTSNDIDPQRKMSGSEKKAKLLAIVRAELDRHGMNAKDPNYKKCIKKLHEMCRMMLKGLTTADKLIPLMEKSAKANAPLVISLVGEE